MRIYHETLHVGPESIDVQGHVNNREYLRWMEGVATRHAALLGWGLEDLQRSNRGWVAREHWVEYLRPTFAGETLEVYTWIQSIRGPASLRRYAITRSGILVAIGATEWVYVDTVRARPVSIDPEALERVRALLVPEKDEELVNLGIARAVRFAPAPSLLG